MIYNLLLKPQSGKLTTKYLNNMLVSLRMILKKSIDDFNTFALINQYNFDR